MCSVLIFDELIVFIIKSLLVLQIGVSGLSGWLLLVFAARNSGMTIN